jgi:hypothetical protein
MAADTLKEALGRGLRSAIICTVYALPNAAASDAANIIPVCLDDVLYELPYQAGLSSSGRQLKIGEGEDKPSSTSPPRFWQPGQPPLTVSKIRYSSVRGSGTPIFVLDFLLGRESQFEVFEISIYRKSREWPYRHFHSLRTPSDLKEGSVLKITHLSDTGKGDEYKSLDFGMFGNPISVRCSAGLPAYSKDPNKFSCNFSGALPDESPIYVSFNVGLDLEGQWPIGGDTYSGWQLAIADVEEAIKNLIPSNGGGKECN